MNHFPKEFIEIARHHAQRRTASNEQIRNSNDLFFNVNPSKSDFIGVLGEMIGAFEMMRKGKAFFLNDLFTTSQVPGADLITKKDGQTFNIDIKATTKEDFCLPVFKVEKASSSNISHYWIIKINIDNNTYLQKFCSVDHVKTWPIEERYKKKVYVKTL